MARGSIVRPALALGLTLVMLVVSVAVTAAAPVAPAGFPSAKLRNGLDRLVANPALLDARIPGLVAGYLPGEIPAFVSLRVPIDDSRLDALESRGARVLRSYRIEPVVALAASPADLLDIASLSWVRYLVPVEVVVALDHEEEVDQSNPPIGTPIDLSVPQLWDQGMTGEGIRIAILDTGMDLAHPDLDDLDFRHWDNPVDVDPTPLKVIDARNFNGQACAAPGSGGTDGHGHGTHVAGIAAGTGEGDPTTAADNGRHLGIAPDAELAIGKVLTDAGAGINSDLIAAFEWAAMPVGSGDPLCPAVGANIVNTSLGSEARPLRLNSGHDVDMVSLFVDRLSAQYGTLFVSAAGNSGPYLGSVLEAPGSASQALSVGAAPKDWDLNHDATASGDTCSGYIHTGETCPADSPGTQPRSVASFSSRGIIEGRYLKPDLVAPGYNIVSAQSSHGAAIAQNDLNINTRDDPLYAVATGTSMASPATAGVAALLLDGYRDGHGSLPQGGSGIPGVRARPYALVRAALMNTAVPELFDSRWILTTDDGSATDAASCPPTPDPIVPTVCSFADIITGSAAGSLVLQGARNRGADPYAGPLAEGAGKVNPAAAMAALRDGAVIYSGADSTRAASRPNNREFQGSWLIGALHPTVTDAGPFVLRSAPRAPDVTATFRFVAAPPSDGGSAIPTSGPLAWRIGLPGRTSLPTGTSRVVRFSMLAPKRTPAGVYSGAVIVSLSNGQRLRVPVVATVPLHDGNNAAGNVPSVQARIVSADDVFAKGNTTWPSLAGAAQGAAADWLAYPIALPAGRDRVRFSVYDAADGDETYDLYIYDSRFDLVASSHPFASDGVTDTSANDARGPTPQSAPQQVMLLNPNRHRYYVVVNRAKVGTVDPINGDFGAFVLSIDEVDGP